jgi:hypothetical protein
MTSRREFIQAGAALSVAATTRDSCVPQSRRPIDLVVFDERFEQCRRFAKESQTIGCPAFATRRDITPLWFSLLEPLLNKLQVQIGGLNDETTIFVLERLAWEKGFHLTYRAEHTPLTDGTAVHLSRAPDLASSMPGREDIGWPASIAKLLISLPLEAAAPTHCSRRRPTASATETLVSWLLAPRHRRA